MGFTLVEVLVVIVIIVVLAGITLPILGRAQERARSAKCVQNLRQIGIGLHAYISENSGRFPDGRADVSWNSRTSRCWYDAAAENMGREYVPYHNGDSLPDTFGCPSGHGEAYEPRWPYTGDYAANWYLGNDGYQAMTTFALKHASSTPYVQDTVRQNQFGSGIFGQGASKTADNAFADRHGGSGNILWVDGHVSSMGYEEYMNLANDPSRGGAYNFIRGNW